MFENTLLLDPDVFADGRYYFKVVASDAPANAPEFALESELTSSPVLIDNTPPDVKFGKVAQCATLDAEIHARISRVRYGSASIRLMRILATSELGGWSYRFAPRALSSTPGQSEGGRAFVSGACLRHVKQCGSGANHTEVSVRSTARLPVYRIEHAVNER